jgi:hypothetical protein
MEPIKPNFDQDPDDTRQYTTHAAWCRYLASRGSLSPYHRSCCHALRCTNSESRVIARKIEAGIRG